MSKISVKTAALWAPQEDLRVIHDYITNTYTKWLEEPINTDDQKQQVRTQQRAWQWLTEGYDAYLSGDYNTAIPKFEESRQSDPTLTEAYKWLGCAAFEAGLLPKAEAAFRELIRRRPDLLLTGEVSEEARTFFDRLKSELSQPRLPQQGGIRNEAVIAVDPRAQYEENFRQGVQRSGHKDYQTAIRYFKMASLWASKEDARVTHDYITNTYTKWLDELHDTPDQAQQVRNQQSAWILLVEGYDAYLSHDYNAAIQKFEASLQLDQNLTEAYKWLGCADFEAGVVAKAEPAFSEVKTRQPALILTGEVSEEARHLFNRIKQKLPRTGIQSRPLLIFFDPAATFDQQFQPTFTDLLREDGKGFKFALLARGEQQTSQAMSYYQVREEEFPIVLVLTPDEKRVEKRWPQKRNARGTQAARNLFRQITGKEPAIPANEPVPVPDLPFIPPITGGASRGKAIVASLAVPGLGQHLQGRHERGWLYMGMTAGAAVAALWARNRYQSKLDDYNSYRDQLQPNVNAQLTPEIHALLAKQDDAYDDAKPSRVLSIATQVVFGLVWGINTIDAGMFGGRHRRFPLETRLIDDGGRVLVHLPF